MRILLCSLLLCLLPNHLVAATLTLDECLAQARKHSPSLRLSRMDNDIAEERVRQSEAAQFPRIDAQGGYTAQGEAQAMKINGLAMETQQPSYLFGNASLQYTLYDFGRRKARIGTARTSADAIKFDILSQEQDIVLQVAENFLAILESQKKLQALDDEVRTVEEHRRIALALYEAGSTTRNDLLQADVRLANVRQQLLAQHNQVENLYLRLNFLTGATATARPQLAEPASPDSQQQVNVDPSVALRQRPDLQALRKNVTSREHDLQESRATFYPEIFTRLSLDYLENNKLREQAIYAGSVGVKINLFDGFSSTATRNKAMIAQSKANERVRLAEQEVRLEIAVAVNDQQVAFQRIAVTKESIRQGEENLRINQSRYQERVGTASDVLDAQTLLTQTRSEHFRAIYDYQRATAKLRKAVGNL